MVLGLTKCILDKTGLEQFTFSSTVNVTNHCANQQIKIQSVYLSKNWIGLVSSICEKKIFQLFKHVWTFLKGKWAKGWKVWINFYLSLSFLRIFCEHIITWQKDEESSYL